MERIATGYGAADYLEQAKQIGREKGDCPELSKLCKMAYEAYKAGAISSKEYGKIYATCMEYAYPK